MVSNSPPYPLKPISFLFILKLTLYSTKNSNYSKNRIKTQNINFNSHRINHISKHMLIHLNSHTPPIKIFSPWMTITLDPYSTNKINSNWPLIIFIKKKIITNSRLMILQIYSWNSIKWTFTHCHSTTSQEEAKEWSSQAFC